VSLEYKRDCTMTFVTQDTEQITIGVMPAVQNVKKDLRRRFQFRFWVDAAKSDQYEIGYRLEVLKKSRKYSQTLMNALNLFFSLQDGDTSFLERLFPSIVERLRKEGEERATQSELVRLMREMQMHKTQITGLQAVEVSDDDDPVIETEDASGADVAANFLNIAGSFF
jgi:hypothetical protein